MANMMTQYRFFSTTDLKSVYQEVSILDEIMSYTAFEVCGQLHQF